MLCTRCSAEVDADASACPECEAALWCSGALRATSAQEPAQHHMDVLATRQPPAEWFSDPVVTRTQPRVVAPGAAAVPRQRFVPVPDPDQQPWVRARSAIVIGAAIVVVAVLLGAFHHLLTSTFPSFGKVGASVTPSTGASVRPATGASVARPSALTASASASAKPAATKSSRPVTGSIPASAAHCGAGVGAGSGTSCGLARAVAAKVPDWPKDSFKVTATSPSSGKTYTVNCVAAAITVCTGGRALLVYVLK